MQEISKRRKKSYTGNMLHDSIFEEDVLQTFSHKEDEEQAVDPPSPRSRSRSMFENARRPTCPLFLNLGNKPGGSDRPDSLSHFESLPHLYRRSNRHLGRMNTQLLAAVNCCNITEVQRLLDAGASPNATCHTEYISACHIAALHNNDILSILLKRGAERGRTDHLGRTPLHLAAWMGNLKPISALLDFPEELQKKLESGEITPEMEEEIKNHSKRAHLKDIVDVICVLGDLDIVVPKPWRDNVDHSCKEIDLPFLHPGWTPLHAAASYARHQCCRVLLAAGAEPCIRDLIGRTPLDVAGSACVYGQQNKQIVFTQGRPSGSTLINFGFTEVIKILLTTSCKRKSFKKTIILDTPLHTAVELQSLDAITLLLKAGISPRNLNRAGLTPLHLCVKKKLKEHLQTFLYFDGKPETSGVVNAPDKDGYTVLHFAVLNNWAAGVGVALEATANILIPANNGETPLHTAAALGNLDILQEILRRAKSAKMIDTLNQKGETALFKAILNGQTDCVKMLLKEGASIKTTLRGGFNVFHVAAKMGNLDILKILLDHNYTFTREKVNVVAAEERRGFGPIHFAVVNNHIECVKLLLSKNAFVSLKTAGGVHKEVTPLHIAAERNNLEIAKIIIKFDGTTIHNIDAMGWTPLHTACYYASRDVIQLLILEGADLSSCTTDPKKYPETAVKIMMNNLTKPTEFLESIFDMYIYKDPAVCSDISCQEPDERVKVDYSVLVPQPSKKKHQMKVVEALLKTGNRFGQKRLLLHPLVESFLCLKWKALLPFFYAVLFLNGLFVMTLTIFVMSEYFYKDNNMLKPFGFNKTFWTYALYVAIAVIVLQEIIFVCASLKHYVLQKETWMKLASIVLAASLPVVIEKYPPQTKDSVDWPRNIATTTVLLCWLDLTFLLSRFPSWGYYVLMFGKVSSNVIKILLTFAFLLVGFSLSFMIQFHNDTPFESPWAALVKTMVMMTSEFDYDDLVDKKDPSKPQIHSLTTVRFVFLIFLILAAIVLMNLMVGVAVHDLHNLEVLGHIMRLEKQVEFFASLETWVLKKLCLKVLPNKLKCHLFFSSWVTGIVLKPCQPSSSYYKVIPANIRDAIFEKAFAKKKNEDHQFGYESLKKQLEEVHEKIMKVEVLSGTSTKPSVNRLSSQQNIVSKKLTDTDMIIVRMKRQVDDLSTKVDILMDMMIMQRQEQIKNCNTLVTS